MTKSEFNVFQTHCRVMLGSIFARKTSKILIGIDSGFWYFSNLTYKVEKQTRKLIDDFYMYRPDSEHHMHAVQYKDSEIANLFKDFFKPLTDKGLMLMVDTILFFRVFATLKDTKDWTTVELSLKLDDAMKHFAIVAHVDVQAEPIVITVGRIFNGSQTAKIGHILQNVCKIVELDDPDKKIVDLERVQIKHSEVSLIEVKFNDSKITVPFYDGLTNVSPIEYTKKVDMPWNSKLHVWPVGTGVYDAAIRYEDDHVVVISYSPGTRYFLHK